MPATRRRPRKTTPMPPVASTRVHSSVGTPGPGLHPHRPHPARDPHPGPPGDVADHRPRASSAQVVGDEGDVGVGEAGQGPGQAVGGAVVQQAVPQPAVAAPGQRGRSPRCRRRPGPRLTTSTSACGSRRSGQSTSSRVRRDRPSRAQSSARASARSRSAAMWTARSSSGARVRAYWMARAALRSRRSTSTSTTWWRRTGAVAARRASCSSSVASALVLPVEAHDQHHADRHQHDDHPRPVGELGHRDHQQDHARQQRPDAVDGEPGPPTRAP